MPYQETTWSIFSKIPHLKKFCFISLVIVTTYHLVTKSIEKVRVAFLFHWNPLLRGVILFILFRITNLTHDVMTRVERLQIQGQKRKYRNRHNWMKGIEIVHILYKYTDFVSASFRVWESSKQLSWWLTNNCFQISSSNCYLINTCLKL